MMPKYFIPMIYTGIFAAILVTTVPKKEIRRLAIYGIIFGAILDVLAIIFGRITGLYEYINYGLLGIMGLHFFAPISWTIYFMLYFYFLPKQKPLIYPYVTTAIFYCIFFGNLLMNLGVFRLTHRILDPLIAFSIWIPAATWSYLWLANKNLDNTSDVDELDNLKKTRGFILTPHPAKKVRLKSKQNK